MSTIKSSTTLTTAYSVEADTTGALVIQTGAAPTTAVTVAADQSVTFAQAANLPNTFGFKNRIINGAMVIDQRNAGASVSISGGGQVFGVDRWAGYASGGGVFSAQQSTTAPAGFKNSWLATVTTADASVAAGDYYMLEQNIEGLNVSDLDFGLSSASTVTLSFWVRSSLTGTYSGGLLNSGANRAYPFTYSISSANTWEQKSVTITGDTSGTWLTTSGIGLRLRLSLGSGSTWQASAGSWAAGNYFAVSGSANWIGTISNNFYITGVQLEKGSTATSFDYLDYGRSLIQCQRYFQKESYVVWSGNATSGSIYYTFFEFPVQMRAAPTMTYSNVAASGFPASASTTNQVTASQVSWQRTSNGTTNGAYYAEAPTMSAEL